MLIEFAESSHSLVLSKATWVLEDQRHDKFDFFGMMSAAAVASGRLELGFWYGEPMRRCSITIH